MGTSGVQSVKQAHLSLLTTVRSHARLELVSTRNFRRNVIPAQARIQAIRPSTYSLLLIERHSRAGGNPGIAAFLARYPPARV